MKTQGPTLRIRLVEGTDMTGPEPKPFPEVRIAGNEAGLRLLRREISRVLAWSREDPGAHTHFTGLDGPGIQVSPAGLVLTIGALAGETRDDEG